MDKIKNLHLESFYLQGARDLLLRLLEQGGGITYNQGKEDKIYSDAVFKEILYNRESLVKFLQGTGWRYYDYDGGKNNKVFLKEYKLKRPLWLVALFFIFSLVPILNIILPIVSFVFIGVCISEQDIFFYSENKIINFLNKNI